VIFLDHAVDAGLAGVKIDFINGESKEQIDFERRVLALGAERRLMIDFHGLQKPTGEERTFPNGMSREAVRGIELNRMPEGPYRQVTMQRSPLLALQLGQPTIPQSICSGPERPHGPISSLLQFC
jgi:Glycoside hydrolase 97